MSTIEQRFSHDLDRFYARKENRDVFACCRAGMERHAVADPKNWYAMTQWRCDDCGMLWQRNMDSPSSFNALIGA